MLSQGLIRFLLLSVLTGALLIAAGCQQKSEESVAVESEVVVDESVAAPVVEVPVVEIEAEASVEAEGEAAAQ